MTSQEYIHPAYDIFMAWHELQRQKELDDFLCWREIQIAKEENDLHNEVEFYRETYPPAADPIFETFYGRRAIEKQKAEARYIRNEVVWARLKRESTRRGENWDDFDPSHIPSLYKTIHSSRNYKRRTAKRVVAPRFGAGGWTRPYDQSLRYVPREYQGEDAHRVYRSLRKYCRKHRR